MGAEQGKGIADRLQGRDKSLGLVDDLVDEQKMADLLVKCLKQVIEML